MKCVESRVSCLVFMTMPLVFCDDVSFQFSKKIPFIDGERGGKGWARTVAVTQGLHDQASSSSQLQDHRHHHNHCCHCHHHHNYCYHWHHHHQQGQTQLTWHIVTVISCDLLWKASWDFLPICTLHHTTIYCHFLPNWSSHIVAGNKNSPRWFSPVQPLVNLYSTTNMHPGISVHKLHKPKCWLVIG